MATSLQMVSNAMVKLHKEQFGVVRPTRARISPGPTGWSLHG